MSISHGCTFTIMLPIIRVIITGVFTVIMKTIAPYADSMKMQDHRFLINVQKTAAMKFVQVMNVNVMLRKEKWSRGIRLNP